MTKELLKDLCEFMSGTPTRLVTTLTCLGTIGLVQMEIKIIHFVTWSHKTMVERSFSFMSGGSFFYATSLPTLVPRVILAVQIEFLVSHLI